MLASYGISLQEQRSLSSMSGSPLKWLCHGMLYRLVSFLFLSFVFFASRFFKFAKLNKVASQGRRGAQVIADGGARKTLESVAIFTYGH